MAINVPAEALHEGILVVSAERRIVFASRRAGEILACDPESLLGQDIGTLVDAADRHRINSKTKEAGAGTASVCELALGRPGQSRVNMLLSIGRFDDGDGHNVCLALTDLGEVHRLRTELRSLGGRDPLTGLPTKEFVTAALENEWKRVVRYKHPLSCLMIDVDDLKAFNGSYGHQSGDELLKQFADVIIRSMRDTDIVARYEGGQFCIVMPETPLEGAMTAAERLRFTIAARDFSVAGRFEHVTASIGVFAREATAHAGPDKLLSYAGAALAKAKANGGNSVYGPPVSVARHGS